MRLPKSTSATLATGELAVGDVVLATWRTKADQLKQVRGFVEELKGERVRITWIHNASRGREINFAVKFAWRTVSECRKVQRVPGELHPQDQMFALLGLPRRVKGEASGG